MHAVNLEAACLTNPLGIDMALPRLRWQDESGIAQSAYEIISRADDGSLLWDTGKVESASMELMWPGIPLRSRERVS